MRAWPYHRVAPSARPAPALAPGRLKALCDRLGALPRHARQSPLPACYTYIGQFLAHDLSFLRQTALPAADAILPLEQLVQARKPVLDLDSVYGAGLDDATVPYDLDRGCFVLGSTTGGRLRDLPRDAHGQALIADPRNDEHLLISQLQVLLMRCHNRMVDCFEAQGLRGAEVLHARARQETTALFQAMVLHDFCWWLLPRRVYRHVIEQGRGLLHPADSERPSLALEVAGAALRLHSMVAPSYRINRHLRLHLPQLFAHAGEAGGRGYRLEDEAVVDWRYFLWREDNGGCTPNHALPLSTAAESFVGHHSHPVPITELTLRRGQELALPSGQELLAALRLSHCQDAEALDLQTLDMPGGDEDADWREQTPLWAYLMLEAGRPGTPHKLGILGGWLLASSLRTAILASKAGMAAGWVLERSPLHHHVLRHHPTHRRHRVGFADLVRFTCDIEE